MSQHRTITLDLAEPEFSRLEAEAKRAGVPTETLVRTAINRLLGRETHDPRRALDELRRLRATLPETDAVEIVQEGRAALDARTAG